MTRTRHDGDCSIYAALSDDGMPEAGICTCGFAHWLRYNNTDGCQDAMYSNELTRHLIKTGVWLHPNDRPTIEEVLDMINKVISHIPKSFEVKKDEFIQFKKDNWKEVYRFITKPIKSDMVKYANSPVGVLWITVQGGNIITVHLNDWIVKNVAGELSVTKELPSNNVVK